MSWECFLFRKPTEGLDDLSSYEACSSSCRLLSSLPSGRQASVDFNER